MISVEEAFQLIAQSVSRLPFETIALAQSVGRVIAADVIADVDSPPHHKSVMDGFAVRSSDIRDWPHKVSSAGDDRRRNHADAICRVGNLFQNYDGCSDAGGCRCRRDGGAI